MKIWKKKNHVQIVAVRTRCKNLVPSLQVISEKTIYKIIQYDGAFYDNS